ncbi:aldehyde dehydrogenase family protein, partial [Mycobacterium tuberculosis]
MRNYLDFYIDGRWTPARDGTVHDVIDPARERVAGRITLGTPGDVDLAVAAARRAFNRYSLTTREERL